MNYIKLFIICTLLFIGCGKKEQTIQQPVGFNEFRIIVINAADGDSVANKKLSNLIDPGAGILYSNIVVDYLRVNPDKQYFFTIVEYQNPLYNRFAVYDSDLNLYLLDKSLNSNISYESENNYIKVHDNFITKNIINLNRLSIYRADTSSFRLAFRAYQQIAKPDFLASQEITFMNQDTITTKVSTPIKKMSELQDIFIYNNESGKYISRNNYLDSIIINEVNKFQTSDLKEFE